MKLRNVLAAYKRIAITGAPRTGKTTITQQVTDRPVIHTDDWMREPWTDVPLLVKAACEQEPEAFVVEGVQVPRTLRKGLEVDAVVYLTTPQVPQTQLQINMGKAVGTVLSEWAATHPNVPIITGLTLDSCDMKRRYLTFTLDSEGVTPTPQGGRRYPAKATKAGVFQYNRGGQIVREYRPANEIKRALGTLKSCPVVLLHPQENGGEVDIDNAKRLSCGHFEDPVWDEAEQCARGFVVINDRDALDTIDGWVALTGGADISCGYDNARDPTPGVSPDSEEYDLVQIDYTFNHVAIGPRGWGRQGTDVGLTLDSDDNEQGPFMSLKTNPTKTADSAEAAAPGEKPTMDAPMEGAATPAPAEASALTPEDIAVLKQLVSLAPALNQMCNTGGSGMAPATLDTPAQTPAPVAAPAPVAPQPETEKKTLDAKDVERIAEAAAQEGAEVRTDAVRLLGTDYSWKGKSTRQVRLDVVRSLDSNFDEKASDPELKAAYAVTLKALERTAQNRAELAGIRSATFTKDSADKVEYKQLGNWVFESN